MPTPKQLQSMKEFYSRPDFVVNEVIDLPSSDDEEEEGNRRNISLNVEQQNKLLDRDRNRALVDDDD